MTEDEKSRGKIGSGNGGTEYFSEEGCFITELLNHPGDESVSIARARVLPGQSTVCHALTGVTERYVIIEGQGIVTVGGLPPENVSAGDVVVIPDGVTQAISNSGAADLIFLCICTPRFRWDIYRRIDGD